MTKCYNCRTKIVPELWFSVQVNKSEHCFNNENCLKKSSSISSGLNNHQYKYLWFCGSNCMREYASEIQLKIF